MRGDRLQLTTVGAWLALGALIVVGTVLLPRTHMWVDSALGLQGAGLGSKLARADHRADAVLARREPIGGLAAGGHGRLPRAFPRCWRRGLRTAASMRRSHWSPTEPGCWRRAGIRPLTSARARRSAYGRSHALGAESACYAGMEPP